MPLGSATGDAMWRALSVIHGLTEWERWMFGRFLGAFGKAARHDGIDPLAPDPLWLRTYFERESIVRRPSAELTKRALSRYCQMRGISDFTLTMRDLFPPLPGPLDCVPRTDEQLRRYVAKGREGKAWRLRRTVVSSWQTYALQRGLAIYEPDSTSVAAYLALISPFFQRHTLETRREVLSAFFRRFTQKSPTDDALVRDIVKGNGKSGVPIIPLFANVVAQLLQPFGDTPLDRRDYAIVLLTYVGGWAPRILAPLRTESIRFTQGGVMVYLADRIVFLDDPGDERFEVAKALSTLIAHLPGQQGPLFRATDARGALTGAAFRAHDFTRVLARTARVAGVHDRCPGARIRLGMVIQLKRFFNPIVIAYHTGRKSLKGSSRILSMLVPSEQWLRRRARRVR